MSSVRASDNRVGVFSGNIIQFTDNTAYHLIDRRTRKSEEILVRPASGADSGALAKRSFWQLKVRLNRQVPFQDWLGVKVFNGKSVGYVS